MLGSTYKKLGPDALKPLSEHITFLNKCVIIKDSNNLSAMIDVKILNCEESYIYINQAVDCLFISDCVNCTIFAAAVGRVCTLANSESVHLTVAAGATRVGNCVDCSVFQYSHCGAPVIYGDTRNLTIAPHNAGYTDLPALLKDAGLNTAVGDFGNRLNYYSSPMLMHVPK